MRIPSLKSRTHAFHLVRLAITVVAFLLWPQIASANAAPPMPRTWFTFVDGAGQAVNPSAVQILECGAGESKCSASAAVLAHFGNCSATACASGTSKAHVDFGCSKNICLLMSFDGMPVRFKLVAQQGNQAYESGVVAMAQQQGYGAQEHFKVAVAAAGQLTLTPDSRIPALDTNSNFGPAFLLTLISELAVIALLLVGFKQTLWPLLGLAGLMQVLSFPVVWTFFPSFLPWHLPSERLVGAVLLISALGLGGLLVWLRLASTRNSRVISIVLLALAVPISLACLFGTFLVAGYGNNEFPNTAGVSYPIVLVGAELFAVGFEAVLLYFFSRRTLSIQRSALVSLAANAVSFVLGLLLFPIAPPLV